MCGLTRREQTVRGFIRAVVAAVEAAVGAAKEHARVSSSQL